MSNIKFLSIVDHTVLVTYQPTPTSQSYKHSFSFCCTTYDNLRGAITKTNSLTSTLLPFNRQTKEDKCEIFALKNSMINIPSNFSSIDETKCKCGELEKMVHIYECDLYNNEKLIIPFERIFNGNLNEQIAVYEKFKQNMEKRKQLKEISYPCDLFDPLLCSKG